MAAIDPANVRHPLDPDPVPSTKAAAVLALGVVAAITGFFVGGLIPAALALLMARDARREMSAAGGFLTGGRRIRTGVALAWVGIVLAACALVAAAIVGLLHSAGGPGTNFAPDVN
ncbi:hypothetical protein GCM10023322_04380 [Rugosimonospora acidiphila]|uniref:DUF4190 domain-containing protein n=1 Tax=Rugosimonospora acidiphila TaxID=556531 RepID=A0ABP9RHX3_9ACTN